MPETSLSSQDVFQRDFDDLRLGEPFATPGRTITEADVTSFAALTGDWHPQHADAEWAADSPFGERIAHGMLVLSYSVGLVPFAPERVLALRRVSDAVFKQPARFGDTIRVEGQIDDLSPLDERFGLVATGWRVVAERGRTLVRAKVEVLWRREAGEPEAGPGDLWRHPEVIPL